MLSVAICDDEPAVCREIEELLAGQLVRADLFIIDLFGLGLLWRIISFFVFGGILIAVSFINQYYSKRIEAKAEKGETLENQ